MPFVFAVDRPMDENGKHYQNADQLTIGAERDKNAHPDVILVQITQYCGQHKGDHIDIEQSQTGMNKSHIFESEEESGHHGDLPGKIQFGANKIENDDTERTEDNRKEAPTESVIGEDINFLQHVVSGDRRAAGAAPDNDLILSRVGARDFHLFPVNSDSGADIDHRSVADIESEVCGAIGSNILIGLDAGVVFGGFKSVEDIFAGDDEEFS